MDTFHLQPPSPDEETPEHGFHHKAERDKAYKEPIHGQVTINLQSKIEDVIGMSGRLIGASKSTYRRMYPDHDVLFNACIFSAKGEEIWYGDIDLTLDAEKLQEVANLWGDEIVVTPEHPFRWDGLTDSALEIYGESLHRFSPQTES